MKNAPHQGLVSVVSLLSASWVPYAQKLIPLYKHANVKQVFVFIIWGYLDHTDILTVVHASYIAGRFSPILIGDLPSLPFFSTIHQTILHRHLYIDGCMALRWYYRKSPKKWPLCSRNVGVDFLLIWHFSKSFLRIYFSVCWLSPHHHFNQPHQCHIAIFTAVIQRTFI